MKIRSMLGLLISLLLFSAASAQQAVGDGPVQDVGSVESFDPRVSVEIPEEPETLEEITDDAVMSVYGAEKTIKRNKPRVRAAPGPTIYRTDTSLSATALQEAKVIRDRFRSYSDNVLIVHLIQEARQNLRVKSYVEKRVDPVTKAVSYAFFCYRAVKEALQGAGLVRSYLAGGEARESIQPLTRAGFKNLFDDVDYARLMAANPRFAPMGAILVYANNLSFDLKSCRSRCTSSSAGHIEIKTAEAGLDGYISVSESYQPTYGYPVPAQRQLIGVMVKKSLLPK